MASGLFGSRRRASGRRGHMTVKPALWSESMNEEYMSGVWKDP